MWFEGDSEPSNFPVGLRSMPSILSNLISLDTSMALLALRLVAYHLPEENLCLGATDWIRDLYKVSWVFASARFIHNQTIARLKILNIPVSLAGLD